MNIDVLTPKTFIDLQEFGVNCKKDKHNDYYITSVTNNEEGLIRAYPRWVLSCKKPMRQITLCKIEYEGAIRKPIVQFRWKSRKYGIRDDQVGILVLAREEKGYIPAVVSEISRSVYDDAYVKYLGVDGYEIFDILAQILNQEEEIKNDNTANNIGRRAIESKTICQ